MHVYTLIYHRERREGESELDDNPFVMVFKLSFTLKRRFSSGVKSSALNNKGTKPSGPRPPIPIVLIITKHHYRNELRKLAKIKLLLNKKCL